jgi:hypothetical protein
MRDVNERGKSKESAEEVQTVNGWTRGKAGWEKSSAGDSGFRFGRYK